MVSSLIRSSKVTFIVKVKHKITVHHIFNGERFRNLTKDQYVYLGVLVGFIIMATAISWGYSRDSVNYNRLFEMYGTSGWGQFPAEVFSRETFFLVVSKPLYSLGLNSIFLFLVYAAIALSVKFYLIDRYSKDKWLSLAFFASYYFILHDSTQIRFSLAIAFVYLGLSFLANNQRYLFMLIVLLSAMLFHRASFVFIVMLFLTRKQSLTWLLALICLAVSLYFVDFRAYLLDTVVPAIRNLEIKGVLIDKLLFYIQRHNIDVNFGLFNWRVLPVYFCAIALFQYRSTFSKYELLCYKSLLVSIFFYILLKDLTEIQYRFSGLFGFSLVFLVPYIHKWLSEKLNVRNSYIILVSFFIVYLIKFAFYDRMIII